jgi:hypothetical protein
MKILKNIWDWADGNKTIICMSTATLLQQAVKYDLLPDSKGLNFLIGIAITFGTGSLGHHIKKGYFSKNKGR